MMVMMMVMEEDLEMPRWLCCCCLDEWRKFQVVTSHEHLCWTEKKTEKFSGREEKGKGNLQTNG